MVSLEELNAQIRACQRCQLRFGATAPVCGSGEIGAKYLLLGEAPGKHEDKAGVPFVGLAGKRLDKLISLAGIDINSCYLTNVCKCRPPDNRTPRKSERSACYQWLKAELELIQPEYIIALGATPLSLFSDQGIRQMHGTQLTSDGYNVIAQYHPAAALHNPRLWAVMLDDWQHLPEKVDTSYTVYLDYPIAKLDMFAIDTENDVTGDLGAWSVAFRNEKGQMCILPFHGSTWNTSWWGDGVAVAHNWKWDLRVLDKSNMKRPKNIADTMIAAYCLGYGRQETSDLAKDRPADSMVGGLGLKYLARRHLGAEMLTWEQVKDTDKIQEYNAMDSVTTYLLFEKWKLDLPEHFWTIDMPLLEVCMSMEDRGMMVDPDFLKRYADEIDGQLQGIDLQGINPYSPKQVGEYVYGTLGMEPTRFTENKQPSTDKEVLETIDDPIVKRILQYRELYKERRTYVSSYASRMDALGRIHPEFKQTSTATGRLSCARPNLQNVTRDRDDKQSKLQELFIAPEGYSLVRLDFKQLELRVFAAIALEEKMLDAFAHGRDPHQETADFLGIQRPEGRNVNFLMLYGGGAWKISNEFGVPIDRAEEMIRKYYKMYPGIQRYHENMIEIAHNKREVVNWFGRKRRLDSMYSEHWRTIKEGEREAINTPVQSTAAEIVKIAMIRLHYDHQAPMISQVHDELIFEVPKKDSMTYAEFLYKTVPEYTEINGVKFLVDVGVGQSWAESKKNEVFG